MDKLTAVLFLLVLIRFVVFDLYFMNYHKTLSNLLKDMAKDIDKNNHAIRKFCEFIPKMSKKVNQNSDEIEKLKKGKEDEKKER